MKRNESKAPPQPEKVAELFGPRLLRPTLVGSGLAFVAVFGLWGATNWTPTLVWSLPQLRGLGAGALARDVSYATMMLNAGALVGYLSFGPLADRFGRRAVFAFMCVGSLVMLPLTFLTPRSYAHVLLLLPLGLLQQRLLQRFPHLPAGVISHASPRDRRRLLLQRRPRAGVGGAVPDRVSGYGVGRVWAAASAIALIYLVGLAILPFAPETKGQPLPE